MDESTRKTGELNTRGEAELSAAEQAEAEALAAEEAARTAAVRAQMARAKANQWKNAGEAPKAEETAPPAPPEEMPEEEPEDTEEPEKKPRKKRKGPIIFGVILALIVAAAAGTYVYFNQYFKDHFFIHAMINGVDVSFKSAGEARELLAEKTLNYSLKVSGRNDLTAELSARDLGMYAEDDGAVEKLLKAQEGENWVLSMFHVTGGDVEMRVGSDPEVLKAAVSALPMLAEENIKAPTNAALDSSGETCVLIPEDEGCQPDPEKVAEVITAAVEKKTPSVDLEAEDCYVHPAVTSEDPTLNARVEAWNKILSADVSYVFGENKERVTGKDARSHVIDDGKSVKLDETFAHDLVYAWGRKYDTFGLARKFKTTEGKTITIPYGGDYGWCSNKDKTIADLEEAILSGATGEREPVWLFKAMGWDNNDLTGTYVEVSIAKQHLWCYKDGELLVDTPVVTGSLAEEDTETIKGCFAIDAKVRDKVLGVQDVQGYENPVSFWMPFNGGQGLHDAPWRVDYGGNIYKTNGSHGCVNTPYDAMSKIYNALEIGHAVVVY